MVVDLARKAGEMSPAPTCCFSYFFPCRLSAAPPVEEAKEEGKEVEDKKNQLQTTPAASRSAAESWGNLFFATLEFRAPREREIPTKREILDHR